MKILLIEDDLDDIELLQEGLGDFPYEMDVANDGGLAVEYIKASKSRPDLIVLDLNLPKIHGRDVILEIKASPLFQHVPLIILTTSSAKEDMEYAYKNGADKYLLKPTDSQQLDQIVSIIYSYSPKKPA
ncbi:MAG: response regulator [Bacteroidota bacterium]|nr:response regulator [Bacteroidota bacterium]MDP4215015.1 response regulator [Bacteroidota bacterium]MDP4244237.1 response regulator [Bacteroidota bacterium]MDP4255972.1 response regulator [Bacteroidota bacterium]MDP4258897.1 response regulator [Bacteroidota bacterium]